MYEIPQIIIQLVSYPTTQLLVSIKILYRYSNKNFKSIAIFRMKTRKHTFEICSWSALVSFLRLGETPSHIDIQTQTLYSVDEGGKYSEILTSHTLF